MQPGGGEREIGVRPVVYCIVPRPLAAKLHDSLRRHFRDDASVEVVVEHRSGDRRGMADRRASLGAPDLDRRRVRNPAGRRVEERRAALVPVEGPPLPRRAARYADSLVFLERLEPSTQEREDADTARLVIRFQAGDQDAFSDIYLRYFDRVYAYVLVAMRDEHEAEDATQQIFLRTLEALPRYERRAQPFRAWLFRIVRNLVIDQLAKLGRVNVVDPAELHRRQEDAAADHEEVPQALDWISDRELMIFIDRLPLPQRQVLVMRYMLGLSTAQMSDILERSPADIRALQSRALRFLRERLIGIGREPKRPLPRARTRRSLRPAHVLRSRRFALH